MFGSFFLAPAVPADHCLIRFTLNASVTREQLDHVASVCAEIFAAVEAACWRSTRRRRPSALLVPSERASDSQARTPQRRPGES